MTMLDLVTVSAGPARYAFIALSFAAFFLAFLFAFLALAQRVEARRTLSSRLSDPATRADHGGGAALRRRGGAARDQLSFAWLRQLTARSGVGWAPSTVTLTLIATGLAAAALAFAATRDPLVAVLGLGLGAGLPLLVLAIARRKRLRQFEAQLPEAIETLVRALRAGHPVSAAIRMVVRELPDPIGAEFAVAADEMTYGLDLETAIGNINKRVGQQDLALIVIAIGIQSRSGGNLAELLASIAKVIRDRLRMRLKVKALSAEGRFSAVLLSILPFALFGILGVLAPQFYGEIWAVPFVKPVLLAATVWMFIGDVVMYRMVNFDI
jgi:tight adherence protein B